MDVRHHIFFSAGWSSRFLNLSTSMIMGLDSVKAILLAAGYGTRMQPLTDTLPKALVPLVGNPLIRHTISRLLQADISSIGINTHHHAGLMQKFAAEQTDCSLHVSHEPEILGSAGGIRGFRDFLDKQDYFLCCNGDSISNITYEEYLPDFLLHGPLIMLMLHDCPGFNNVCINSTGDVIDIRDRLKPSGIHSRLAYTGTAFINRNLLELIPPGASELVPLLIELITRKPGSVRAAIARNIVWRDIGNLKSYIDAHREIMQQRLPLIPIDCIPAEPILTGNGTVIGRGCTMEGFASIGSHCRIGPGCTLRDCIIWDNTTIEAGTVLDNAVCGPGFMINVE